MSETRRNQVKELFSGALERAPEERAVFLDGACRSEPALRKQVEALLAAYDEADEFLAAPTGGGQEAPASEPLSEEPGTVIGNYKLLQRIGEGGFGAVFMAEQSAPVQRKVALKIIKLGMDTKQVIARFEAERQALAMMDHPNIARVLDGGATHTGRPYFVMELVKGISITDYCNQNKLATRDRLELLIAVCRAVQHAHQKGIIHRDIKPSNVMVTLHDGKPVPKVIDFGIAKATTKRLTDKTLFTEYRQFIGTPEYMSPEQAEMSGLDIDTRTDIYALGVLLYELLTGTTPFDPKRLRTAGYGEIQRIIREEDPPKPSTRLATIVESGSTTTMRSSSEPRAVGRAMRGDLDWIVMKALEKDRTRRYDTATNLAEDLDRFLENEPVLAGPPSTLYKLKKLVQRNRAAVAFAGVIALLLVAGIVGTTWGMLQASKERDRAVEAKEDADRQRDSAQNAREEESRQRTAAEQASKEAERSSFLAEEQRLRAVNETARAQAATDFLVRTLSLANPAVALTPEMPMTTVLDMASEDVGRALEGQPLAEATIRATIGRAYFSLGQPDQAIVHLRAALELHEELEGIDPYERYGVLWALTGSLAETGDPEAQSIGSQTTRFAIQILIDLEPELGRLTEQIFGAIIMGQGGSAARAHMDRADAIARERLPDDHPVWPILADTYFIAGMLLWTQFDDPSAEPFLRRGLEVNRHVFPESHPAVANQIEMLVLLLTGAERFEEAEQLIRESIEIRQSVLPEGHWHTAGAESMLGTCLAGQGRFEEAERVLVDAHARIAAAGDRARWASIYSLTGLVSLYDAWPRPEAAERYRRELAQAIAENPMFHGWAQLAAAFGPDRSRTLAALTTLRDITQRSTQPGAAPEQLNDEFAEAAAAFTAAWREEVPPEDPASAIVVRQLTWCLPKWRPWVALESVDPMLELVQATRERWDGKLDTDVGMQLYTWASRKLEAGAVAEAEQMARQAVTLLEPVQGVRGEPTRLARMILGRSLLQQGRMADAERELRIAYEASRAEVGDWARETANLRRDLMNLYTAWGRSEQARACLDPIIDRVRDGGTYLRSSALELNNYAWFLLTCEPAELRDPESALLLARRAVELSEGGEANSLDTLALARFETGDRAGAIETQERALALLPDGDDRHAEFAERMARYNAAD